MSKNVNSELIIKTKVWEKETFELIDYLNDETINTKIQINSSGMLCRDEKTISFNPGENLAKTQSELLRIKKNPENGKFIINCGNWSKDLSKLVDEQGAFLVYRGLSLQELNKNYNYRYYKLSQGDIFKIGRVYFKVLDMHLKREGEEVKSIESSVRGTMIRSSSCNSIVVNGQQVIKGAFSPGQLKKHTDNIYYSKNENNINNNSLLTVKNSNYQKNESLNYFVHKKDTILPKVNSTNELISIKKKKPKLKKIDKSDKKKDFKNIKNELILKKPKKETNKTKPICRICYGEDTNDDNPLICPCVCKGSMKYIHYDCLKNWLNSKIEDDIPMDINDKDLDIISYNRKDISCELCKEKLPDYIKHNNLFYNISFYKPKFEEFIVLESMKVDKEKVKYIHLISFDNKYSINIGRANECELSIAELSVSRYHCMIHKEDGDLYLEDNSSKFGTLILIQNNKMVMNDYVPMRLQINRTYIKLKVKNPFYINCCGCQNVLETKKYDYQLQNRKCFDILSYFIIKEEDITQENENDEDEQIEENKINNNSKQLIDDDNEDKDKSKKEDKDNNDNEGVEDEDKKMILKENEKNENSLSKNEIYSYVHMNQHSTRFKKINIKKAANDKFELPQLDKININNFKDSISLMSDRKKNSKELYNYQQNKQQINLIRINKNNVNADKTHSQSHMINLNSNNDIPSSSSSKFVKNYKHKSKKK